MPRVLSETVDLDDGALWSAARRMDEGTGTVWAADSTGGWHGGAELVRRVTTTTEAVAARDWFTGRCRRVRVMPYLDGIPCSIHGIVVGDRVVTLRPVELLVLGSPDGRFVYTGCATGWDPLPDDRRQLRDIANAVGRRLAVEVGFRGAFTVDGVMTARGFRPTELNPRPGAGLGVLAHRLDLPVALLLDAIVHDPGLDWRVEELEAIWVAHADAHRAGVTARIASPGLPTVEERSLVHVDGVVRPAAVGELPDLRLSISGAEGRGGSLVRARICLDRLPAGESAARLVAAFWAYVDGRYGLGLGPLRPAADRRA